MHKRFIFGSGITVEGEFRFADELIIRPIKFPSDHRELEQYASSQICYGFLCALAETLTFELEVSGETDKDAAISIWNNQWLLILLSIVIRSPVSFPIRSLNPCGKLDKNCCSINAAVISPANYGHNIACTTVELEQSKALYPIYMKLIDNKAFCHAASVAALNFNEPKSDIRMAAIWSGIEALIDVSHELSYRIPLICSIALEQDKQKRLDLFEEVHELYQLRSRCVHGNGVKSDKLNEAVIQSQTLLCRLMEWTCGRGEVLTSKQGKELPILSA